jgi:hypothetical protein
MYRLKRQWFCLWRTKWCENFAKPKVSKAILTELWDFQLKLTLTHIFCMKAKELWVCKLSSPFRNMFIMFSFLSKLFILQKLFTRKFACNITLQHYITLQRDNEKTTQMSSESPHEEQTLESSQSATAWWQHSIAIA